ncbi:unnamed protein product [Fusarium graminearum]|uniref:Uncharacterized protein n=1 Tax=Gibberella zeae TaxID=5518 RepID=A0A4U9FFH8_GIBZA|nr:unnamed protein product [Fusarium graminearum]CAG1968160.1 unnamed protein product [Fusarium graminearum]CAG1977237.1 unnamed protein product [Fusarium graminearum]VTO92543.1 unnamed protein product [Fusarium graminearum]
MSQDAATHLANIAKANGIGIPSTLRKETEVDSFALFQKVLQRPSGPELLANTERLSVLAQDFLRQQQAIKRQKRKEQMINIAVVVCPVLLVAGLWYWYLSLCNKSI